MRGLACKRGRAPRIAALPALPLLPRLRFLYLQENGLRRLAPLRRAPALRLLNLSFNALAGAAGALAALAPAAASLAERGTRWTPSRGAPGPVPAPAPSGGRQCHAGRLRQAVCRTTTMFCIGLCRHRCGSS